MAKPTTRRCDNVILRRLIGSWTSGTAQVGRRSSGGDENLPLVDDGMLTASISVTAAAGLVPIVTAGHAVATNTTSSAPEPISSLGRLISRTPSAETRRPALGRNQRRDPDPSTNTIRVFRKCRRLAAHRCRRNPVSVRCAVPMSNMPLQLTRAGQLSVDGQRAGAARLDRTSVAAARPRQCYYRPSRNGPCS